MTTMALIPALPTEVNGLELAAKLGIEQTDISFSPNDENPDASGWLCIHGVEQSAAEKTLSLSAKQVKEARTTLAAVAELALAADQETVSDYEAELGRMIETLAASDAETTAAAGDLATIVAALEDIPKDTPNYKKAIAAAANCQQWLAQHQQTSGEGRAAVEAFTTAYLDPARADLAHCQEVFRAVPKPT